MNSYKDSFHNNYSIGTKEFMDILNKFNKFQYRDDARDLIRKIFKRTINETQRNTIIRIIGSLPPKTITVPKLSGKKVHKKCPHCQKQTELNIDSTYVICGYTDKGFDLDGCGKDWCFRCEKKLCKSWYVHELFIHDNQYHNDKCCKLMAYKKNESRKKYNAKYKKMKKSKRNRRRRGGIASIVIKGKMGPGDYEPSLNIPDSNANQPAWLGNL